MDTDKAKKLLEEPKNTKKRDFMREYELEAQKFWEENRTFELDADDKKEHWIGTFPYPYMNGVLHLGHAFTSAKVDYAAGYWRLKGVQALFPFGFHCTGMPIKAAADTLKREMDEFGTPPQFPVEGEEEKAGKKESKKAEAKSASKHQWEIMLQSNVPEEEIPKFADAHYWLKYFPPRAQEHLKSMGAKIDWRRSFITTDANPYYDKFIQWQFLKLKKLGKIKFGKRETIYSPKDGQPCMDHDRYSGEGVGIAEFTLIKQELQRPYPEALRPLEQDLRPVYLVPATLRPETMYGQTNCWVLPDGKYGAYAINDKEIWVCTSRAARNLAFQEKSPKNGEYQELLTFKGSDLLGGALKAPLSKYPIIYILPMHTVSTEKTTGVVTSVPSDSPDDFAALRDVKNKFANYGLKPECVLPFEPVPIIDVPGYGTTSAITACEQLKIKSQNDSDLLAKAKELVYMKGFYEGVMVVGEHAGKKVQVAKPLIREQLIQAGQASKYSEPESPVVSRSLDDCVVALCDQWYLDYGEPEWQKQALECLANMNTYGEEVRHQFTHCLDWIHQWACSRSYGLGSRIPWDQQYLIESLSDSTIYMAYYAVAHLLQGGVLDGSVEGPAHIKPEQLTYDVFEYIFGTDEAPFPESAGIKRETLDLCRKEFRNFYPVKLRVSGKDLIPNHLVFWIYNHVALFPKQFWPTGVKANGWLNLNGDKMSKRTGNFITLQDAVRRYSADGMRFALAEAGDTLSDSNFTTDNADNAVLHIHAEVTWVKEVLAGMDSMRKGPPTTWIERVFDAHIDRAVELCDKAYKELAYRDVVVSAFYDLHKERDTYRLYTQSTGEQQNSDLLLKYIRASTIMMAPVISHTSEYVWRKLLGEKTSVFQAQWPTPTQTGPQRKEEIDLLIQQNAYLQKSIGVFRGKIKEFTQPKKKKGAAQQVLPNPTHARIYVATKYPEWQEEALVLLKNIYNKNKSFPENRELSAELKNAGGNVAKNMSKIMALVSTLKEKIASEGEAEAFSLGMSFSEQDLLKTHLKFICVSLFLQNAVVHLVTDEGVPETSQQLATALPGKPLIFLSNEDK